MYGMNPKVGLVSFRPDPNGLQRPYSDATARLIDEEARRMITEAYDRTVAIIEEKKPLVEALAQALLKKEVLGLEELEKVLGARPFTSAEMRNIDKYRSGFVSMGGSGDGGGESAGGEQEVEDKGGEEEGGAQEGEGGTGKVVAT